MQMDTIVDLDPNPDDSDNGSNAGSSSDGDRHDAEEPEDESEENEEEGHECFGNVPVIMPRRRFLGACNSETVKDVNFLGPDDEFVVSGSDDGNFFMWRKSTGDLRGIYEGDGSVVNVIEGHPRLPLVAVSGIDTTVKLFSPVSGHSAFSRMQNADNIIKRNLEATSRRVDLSSLYTQYRLLLRQATRHRDGAGEGGEGEEGEGDEEPTCTFQ
ncbi:hypothetical protein EWM64_g1295 [Hericium alpestre]|uniref:Uncharacterized protein n=1 Tax=Hericium alpestre TaxID=135208 RepID=A0A4Z0A6Q2_9AGAM|nr:hypothetical protein EWM64_g1295 [Hericium alpestre]